MEKCLFIYNPFAGKGKIRKKENFIKEKLSEKYEVEVKHSNYAGHLKEILLEHGEEYSLVVCAGGDGTLNEIIDGVMHLEKKPLIGYIPAGTVNDVAHSLYIPTNTKKAVENILNGKPFAHDVMKVNDRFGIYVCCSGLFTEASYSTSQNVKKKMGKVAYFFHGLKKTFNTKSINLTLKYNGNEISGEYALMLINNSRYTAGMKINKDAVLNDGLVDVVLVEDKKEKVSAKNIFKVGLMFLRGTKHYYKKRGVKHFLLDSFTVSQDDSVVVNLDGEKLTTGNIDVHVYKEGVKIIVPKIEKLQK